MITEAARGTSWQEDGAIYFLLALRSVLEGEAVFLAHGRDDGDHEILAIVEGGLDLVAELTVGDTDVVLGVTVVGHQVQETVVNVDQLVLLTSDVGDVHVVRRGRNVFVLLGGEDVDGDKVDLGVTVLAGLGGRHVDNLVQSTVNSKKWQKAEKVSRTAQHIAQRADISTRSRARRKARAWHATESTKPEMRSIRRRWLG